jgi:membrane protein required for colicin V production
MTLFDLVAGLILAASCIAGLVRGFTREVTTLAAFALAALAAFLALRFTGPIFGQAIHIEWLANAAALLVGFIFVYVILRLMAGALTKRVRETASLSGPDRFLGLVAGLVRGVVVIGAFALVVNAATPSEPRPAWVMRAKLYPLANAVGGAMSRLAPKRFALAHDGKTAFAPGSAETQPKALHLEVVRSR